VDLTDACLAGTTFRGCVSNSHARRRGAV